MCMGWGTVLGHSEGAVTPLGRSKQVKKSFIKVTLIWNVEESHRFHVERKGKGISSSETTTYKAKELRRGLFGDP